MRLWPTQEQAQESISSVSVLRLLADTEQSKALIIVIAVLMLQSIIAWLHVSGPVGRQNMVEKHGEAELGTQWQTGGKKMNVDFYIGL